MKSGAVELLGITVHDLDSAVNRFSRLFGLEFRVFTSGIDFAYQDEGLGPDASAPALPQRVRMAMDTSGCFELIEFPDAEEGFRNIHLRVDDIEAASAHLVANGLGLVQRVRAGSVREFIFDARELYGIRLCLVEYAGDSFAEALTASGPARAGGPENAHG